MWYKMEGKESDIVLCSRVALSRNLEDYPFSDKMTDEQAKSLIEKLKTVYRTEDGWSCTELLDAAKEQKLAMVEQRILPHELAESKKPAAVFQNEDFTVAVTVGGLDHVRIEAVAPGCDLPAALDKAFAAEEALDEKTDLAFTEQFGYVTRNPDLLGTGMRASVTLHLPLLGESGWLSRVAFRLGREGIAIRSLDVFGADTGLYGISCRETMGMSEEEIIKSLTGTAEKLMAREREYRKSLREDARTSLAEEARRQFGMLMYAGRVRVREIASFYSRMRMAAALNLVDIPVPLIDEALFTCLPHTLEAARAEGSAIEADVERAVRVKDVLSRAGLKENH